VATIVPTIYMEPFGGVNVESQLCGTPVITSNFGVFPETVLQGRTGYCCDTLQDFVTAINNCLEGKTMYPEQIRQHAEKYSIHNVGLQFEKWWNDLHEVYLSTVRKSFGWGQLKDGPRPKDVAVDKQTWEEAVKWEANWWKSSTSNFVNTHDEDLKQFDYMKLVGLERGANIGRWVELPKDTHVLDIGSNAVSFLLKCRGHRNSVVVDPLDIPEWALGRYASVDIDYCKMKGEDLLDSDLKEVEFDEVWIYNCLQHVDDPVKIANAARAIAKKRIRIVEWLNIGICPGHIHDLTERNMNLWFQHIGQVSEIIPSDPYGCRGKVWHAVIET